MEPIFTLSAYSPMTGDKPLLPGRTEGTEEVHIRTFLIADVRGYIHAGRHRVSDRFEDLRSVPEGREALPGTVGPGRALERLWIALHG